MNSCALGPSGHGSKQRQKGVNETWTASIESARVAGDRVLRVLHISVSKKMVGARLSCPDTLEHVTAAQWSHRLDQCCDSRAMQEFLKGGLSLHIGTPP